MTLLLAVALVASNYVSAAPKKTLVAPVQGAVGADVAAEMTEQARASAMSAAPGLELLVMSKKTFDKLAAEHKLHACTDADCDVDAAQRMGTELLVSTKVMKVDAKFVITAKLFDVATGHQLAVKNADASSPAQLLAAAPKLTDAVLRAGLRAHDAADTRETRAPSTQPSGNTVLMDGPVAFGTDGDLLGKNGVLMLYPDRLVFQMTGLNFNNKRIEIPLKDVDLVRNSGDEVQVAMTYGRIYRITSNNNSSWSRAIEERVGALKN